MIRSKATNSLILIGLLLVSYSSVNVVSNFAQVRTDKEQAALIPVSGDDSITPAARYDRAVALQLNPDRISTNDLINDLSQLPGERYEPTGQAEEIDHIPQVEEQLDISSIATSSRVSKSPLRIVIPAIKLDAPVIPAETQFVEIENQEYQQWMAPDRFAVGWHESSALLGEPGNTVFNGHHNIHGEVFANLAEINEGDLILVYSQEKVYRYAITLKMILPEKYQQLDVRMDNARWIMPSQDERLTLVTCWPRETNTHRLLIIARPALYDRHNNDNKQKIWLER